jgi:exopolysaccharide biosynthesis WecB/TagA/CpsF family protein
MPLLELAENRKWRIFYLGARPEVLKPGLDLVKEVFPNLLITGHDGYFNASSDSEENRAIITAISEFDPHMLIVGMGMGRQERWIVENFEQLNAQCVATSGTLIEYFAKTVPTPPRWAGRFGLEWVYRLHSQSATLSLALSRRALAGDRINSDLPNPPLCSSAPRQVDMRSDILYRSQSSVPLISSRHGPRTDLSFHSVGDFGPDANRNAGTNGCNLNRVNFEEYVPALCGR